MVSAWKPETAWLARWLRHPGQRRLAPRVQLIAAGVGAVDAGIGAAAAITRWRPRRVVFVGTAGAYAGRPPLPVGAAVVASRLLLASTAALRGDGYLPPPMVARVAADPTLTRALLAAGPTKTAATCACPLAITGTTRLAARLAATTGARVENLEAFAVARAAVTARVPCAAVFGIANRVGPAAHVEWRTHHVQASRVACQVVAAWLSSRG